jgi:hypothetical protein
VTLAENIDHQVWGWEAYSDRSPIGLHLTAADADELLKSIAAVPFLDKAGRPTPPPSCAAALLGGKYLGLTIKSVDAVDTEIC